MERLEVLCLLSAGGRAAPGGRPRCAQVGGLLAAPEGRGDLLTVARASGVFFPTRGKEPKGARWQPIRDSTMAAPGPLAAWLEGGASCCARLIASSRGRHEGIGVLRCSSAGGRAAPVGHPRCARVGGPVGRVTACRLAWRDRSETVRFSAAVHGRRSWSSLRRPPQEVAASLDHGGAHNPHAKRGDRRGAPPERNQPSPLPRRGRCHGESRDG